MFISPDGLCPQSERAGEGDEFAGLFESAAARAMISGVPTSTAALLGEAARGATKPILVTSIDDYRRHFGGPLPGERYLSDAVEGFFLNGGRRVYICRIAAPDAGTATCDALPIAAVGPGRWGNGIFVKFAAGAQVGRFDLSVALFEAIPANPIDDPFDDPALLATADVVETFKDLESTGTFSPAYWASRLEGSVLVRAVDGPFPSPLPEVQVVRLDGGTDGRRVIPADYGGRASGDESTALAALELSTLDEVSLIAAPGMSDPDVLTKLCQHCEQKLYRLAVFDGPRNSEDVAQIDPRARWDTSYAACYVPWLEVPNSTGQRRMVPPSGHVLGVFVRTDTQRGVWKAPANEQLTGVSGVETRITKLQQDELNPRGVNVIRDFEARGIRLWGARTLSTDPEFKYIPVRRYLSFLERSIYEGIKWAVFEPNDRILWNKIRDEILIFLRDQWQQGALLGVTEQEAFFIRCDETTMTADDIQSGRLISVIGLALVRPAEFTVIRVMICTVG